MVEDLGNWAKEEKAHEDSYLHVFQRFSEQAELVLSKYLLNTGRDQPSFV